MQLLTAHQFSQTVSEFALPYALAPSQSIRLHSTEIYQEVRIYLFLVVESVALSA